MTSTKDVIRVNIVYKSQTTREDSWMRVEHQRSSAGVACGHLY
jgi:hypothetical protein